MTSVFPVCGTEEFILAYAAAVQSKVVYEKPEIHR